MIESMVNKKFRDRSETVRPCWLFCQLAWRKIERTLPDDPKGLTQVERPELFDVALFVLGTDWHAGVVWPDGLHFTHAHPTNEKSTCYMVSTDRLTSFPWKDILLGYYR